jgi:hypothetical protein
MPLILIVPTFTLQAIFWGMSRVFTFMLTSCLKLANLLCLCMCFSFICYTFVLSFLLLKVHFGLSLVSFWGCLKLISWALICFIKSFEPFRTRLGKAFRLPLTKLFEIQWIDQHGSFSSYCHVGVCTIFEEVIQVSKRFLFALRSLWWMIGLILGGILLCLKCSSFPLFFGQIFNHPSLLMYGFK